jgi:hypothetical protein
MNSNKENKSSKINNLRKRAINMALRENRDTSLTNGIINPNRAPSQWI